MDPGWRDNSDQVHNGYLLTCTSIPEEILKPGNMKSSLIGGKHGGYPVKKLLIDNTVKMLALQNSRTHSPFAARQTGIEQTPVTVSRLTYQGSHQKQLDTNPKAFLQPAIRKTVHSDSHRRARSRGRKPVFPSHLLFPAWLNPAGYSQPQP